MNRFTFLIFFLSANYIFGQTSNYVTQHLKQSIPWKRYESSALKQAQKADKPLFIHLGYSSCHWCGVMNRETFKSKEVESILKDRYIPIVVDALADSRAADFYQHFLLKTTGKSGFPLNVIALPDGTPFFAETYLPAKSNNEYPMGLVGALKYFSNVYETQKAKARKIGNDFQNGHFGSAAKQNSVDFQKAIKKFSALLKTKADIKNGGMKGEAKFPFMFPYSDFELAHCLNPKGLPKHFDLFTLYRIAVSPLNDQMDGGIHRYSSRPDWGQPHFEKMLDDNIMYAFLLARAWIRTGLPFYKKTSLKTVSFLKKHLFNGKYFHPSLHADSKDEKGRLKEGAYYLAPAFKQKVKHKKALRRLKKKNCLIPFSEEGHLFGLSEPMGYDYFLSSLKNNSLPSNKTGCSEEIEKAKLKRVLPRPSFEKAYIIGLNAKASSLLLKTSWLLNGSGIREMARKTYKELMSRAKPKNLNKLKTSDIVYILDATLTFLRMDSAFASSSLIKYAEKLAAATRNEQVFFKQNELMKLFKFKLSLREKLLQVANLKILDALTENKTYMKRAKMLAESIPHPIGPNKLKDGALAFLLAEKSEIAHAFLLPGKDIQKHKPFVANYLSSPRQDIFLWIKSNGPSAKLALNKKTRKNKTTLYICSGKTCSLPIYGLEAVKNTLAKKFLEVSSNLKQEGS